MAEIRVPCKELEGLVARTLVSAGVADAVASVEAELMVDADLREVPSHGVSMLPGLVAAISVGRVTADPDVRLLRARGATCIMDGDLGPGRYTSALAMDHALERAQGHGVGVCVAANMVHWGRAHAYAERAARAGMIGTCATNAMTNMLAFGSTSPLLGNNPLAIGVPRRGGAPPVVLDMAMSQAALGKVATYRREGREVPEGWGLDADGRPSTDAEALLRSGLVLPMGGHKGSGLSLMVEFLTGALTGGMLSFEIADRNVGMETGSSKVFLALDIESFLPRDDFESRVEDLLAHLKGRSEGEREFMYPGERGARARERNLSAGVPLHQEVAESLAGLGIRL